MLRKLHQGRRIFRTVGPHLLQVRDGLIDHPRLLRGDGSPIVVASLSEHSRRLAHVPGLFVKGRGLFIVLTAAEHLGGPRHLADPLVGVGGLPVRTRVFVASSRGQIVAGFFVHFGGPQRISTQQKFNRRFVLLIPLVEGLASHLGGAHAITRLGVDVGGSVYGTGALIKIGRLDVATELRIKSPRLFPMLSPLQNLGRLFEETRSLEGEPGEAAITNELGVVGWRACPGQTTETIFEMVPVVLGSSLVVAGLGADLRRFFKVADPLESGGRLGQGGRVRVAAIGCDLERG